jgi:Na+-translocating ferredoxin:NAD+ oxidoreductase RnfC subunit
MKPTLSALLLLFTLGTTAQEFKTPVDYLDHIAKETEVISRTTWKYTLAVAHSKSARKIDNSRKTLVKSIQNAKKKIAALRDGYKGDVEYRDQMLAYLTISENQINEEYDKIIDMQEVAEQSYDFMEAYILARDLVNEKINAEIDKLNTNQKVFANKYGIQISENTTDLAKKMKVSNEVFKNQTDLYLIFFKTNVTDAYLMEAASNLLMKAWKN